MVVVDAVVVYSIVDARHSTASNPARPLFHGASSDLFHRAKSDKLNSPTSEADTLLPNMYVTVDHI